MDESGLYEASGLKAIFEGETCESPQNELPLSVQLKTSIMTYEELLESKSKTAIESGFDQPIELMNPLMKEFQKFSVHHACRVGRFALFLDCGMGKTFRGIVTGKQ